ncbi:MAG TPA: VCBS repeat-containing protein, partial [Planctomycetota bacterium]|nr:VCBS repeat-containing protein [Planctomycetota bacterium]
MMGLSLHVSARTCSALHIVLLAAAILAVGGIPALRADDAVAIGDPASAVRFEKQLLAIDANEGSAIVDVDQDGKLDVVAGRFWFQAPRFVPRPVRQIAEFGDYCHSNSDLIHDVNGDGWPDVIASSFLDEGVWWYENPKKETLEKGLLWKAHLLAKTHGENEVNYLRDLDGDGKPELVVNRWAANSPLWVYGLKRTSEAFGLERFDLSPHGNDHGMGFGDINGDGREDILSGRGWWERPEGDPLRNEWTFHQDWQLSGASCPMLVVDLTGDGRNDVIWGRGHDFGLYWREQLEPESGKTRWREHLIDKSYSQNHCLHLADIDGDGKDDLITGKRVRAHSGNDPGGKDPSCLYYYTWDRDARRFTRYTIDEGNGVGTGLQINTGDLDGDG